MEKRIELEKRRRSADQLYELILDNCRSTSIEGLTDEFVNLRFLSLIGVGLTNLKGFPKLAKLRKLELSDNRISGGLHILKDTVPRLTVLNLGNNRIKDLETLEPLKELPDLRSLDLYRNEITQIEDYRDKIFALLPGINFVDSVDREGKDAEESDLDDEEIKEMNGKTEEENEIHLKDVSGDGDGDADEEDEEDEEEEEDSESETDDDDGDGLEDGASNHSNEISGEASDSEDEVPVSESEGYSIDEFDGIQGVPLNPLKGMFNDQLNDDSTGISASVPFELEDSTDNLDLESASPPDDDLRRGKKRRHDEYVDSD